MRSSEGRKMQIMWKVRNMKKENFRMIITSLYIH